MQAAEVIARKRDGQELTTEEIASFVQGVTDGTLPDYQTAALLMAITLRGMTERETLDLTLAMRDSGQQIDLKGFPNGPTLDKHSTGGVGDKTTLVVVPILAAAGVPMLKMSGRGLGFSGGTVDKLESIPGFRTGLTIAEAKAQVQQIGAALIAQSVELAPADKVLYALRDVTATVPSLPLIASSIMSKKLAAGGERIVLDVKVGKGSFRKTEAEAEELAHAMIGIGNQAGVPTSAVLTRMDEPLGFAVGNALEVKEALEVLQNAPNTDPLFGSLCLALAAHGLVAVGKAADEAEGHTLAESLLQSGEAGRKFAEIVHAQGGPEGLEAIAKSLPEAPVRYAVKATLTGVVAAIDAEAIGHLSVTMGAGRRTKGEAIDPTVGIELHRKCGQSVTAGTTIATLHLNEKNAPDAPDFAETLRRSYTILPENEAPAPPQSLVICMIS